MFDAINAGELSGLEDLVTTDFVDHGSPFPLPPGPDGYRQILTFVHHVLRIRYTIEDVFSTEDRVVIRATAAGVGVDAVHGPGTAGKPYRMTTAHIYRTEGSRLAEHWVFGMNSEHASNSASSRLPPRPALPTHDKRGNSPRDQYGRSKRIGHRLGRQSAPTRPTTKPEGYSDIPRRKCASPYRVEPGTSSSELVIDGKTR